MKTPKGRNYTQERTLRKKSEICKHSGRDLTACLNCTIPEVDARKKCPQYYLTAQREYRRFK